jgi:anti-sigma regulatory factor (Ser/Thr protein kinase)
MSGAALTVTIANRLSEIDRLIGEIEAFAARLELPERLVQQTVLALDELVTNLVSYGYEAGDPGHVEVRLAVEDDHLTAEIIDDARPFDPLGVPAPDVTRPVEERPVGGLGIHLVRSLMDSARYERRPGHNRLVLTKRIVRP